MQGDTDTSEIKMSMPEIWIRNPSPMFNHLWNVADNCLHKVKYAVEIRSKPDYLHTIM